MGKLIEFTPRPKQERHYPETKIIYSFDFLGANIPSEKGLRKNDPNIELIELRRPQEHYANIYDILTRTWKEGTQTDLWKKRYPTRVIATVKSS